MVEANAGPTPPLPRQVPPSPYAKELTAAGGETYHLLPHICSSVHWATISSKAFKLNIKE